MSVVSALKAFTQLSAYLCILNEEANAASYLSKISPHSAANVSNKVAGDAHGFHGYYASKDAGGHTILAATRRCRSADPASACTADLGTRIGDPTHKEVLRMQVHIGKEILRGTTMTVYPDRNQGAHPSPIITQSIPDHIRAELRAQNITDQPTYQTHNRRGHAI